MNCDGVQELLSAYVDGELSSGELLRVEQHLRRCPVCAEEIDALRQTVAFVALLPEVELPTGFREGLRARLAELKPQLQPFRPVAPLRPAWHRQVARWAMPVVAAAALALVSTGAYGRLGTTLFSNVADHTPKKEVVTPSVPHITEPIKTFQPPETAGNTNPLTGAVAQEDPRVTVNVHPGPGTSERPLTGTAGPGESNPITQPGQVGLGGGLTVASLSLVEQVKAPDKLPTQIAYTTKMQAMVPDLAATCNLLKNAYGAVCTTKDPRRVQVNFSVAADKAVVAQTQVTTLIGGSVTATTDAVDLSAQLKVAHERLLTLQDEQSKLEQQVATDKDDAQKKADEALLAQKRNEGKLAVEDYHRLEAEINSRLFVIDLQKQGQ